MELARINEVYNRIGGFKHIYFIEIIKLLTAGLEIYIDGTMTYIGWLQLVTDCSHFNYLFNNEIIEHLSDELWKIFTVGEKIDIMFFPIIYHHPEYSNLFHELEGSPVINVCLTLFKDGIITNENIGDILLRFGQIHSESVDSLISKKILNFVYPKNCIMNDQSITVVNEVTGQNGEFEIYWPNECAIDTFERLNYVVDHIGIEPFIKLKVNRFLRTELDNYGLKINTLAVRLLEQT